MTEAKNFLDEDQLPPTDVTLFTGFLGSGKTTIILSLLPALKHQRVVLLKNEYGSVAVDSLLAAAAAASAPIAPIVDTPMEPLTPSGSFNVVETLNGCLCCVLVGSIPSALSSIRATYAPDRIIVESSGSAFPFTLAQAIKGTKGMKLDCVITVVDCVNFGGYEDQSWTARLQAGYSDLVLLNKHELGT